MQVAAGVPQVPPVTVQVRDNRTGTPVHGALVTLTLGPNGGAAVLAGNVAVSDFGIARFPGLTVSTAGNYTLVATATLANVVIATAVSTPFLVTNPLAITTDVLPAGTAGMPYVPTTLQSAGGGGITRTWSLTSGALPPGLTLTPSGIISGIINPSARGNFAFTVQVRDAMSPPQAAVRALTIAVGASADISLGLSGTPDPVYVNSPLTYAVTVANAGPSTATQVAVTVTIPPSAAIVSVADGCGISANGVVICAIGSLAVGTATQLAIVVRPSAEGNIESTASATALEPDPIPNNVATESTTVLNPTLIAIPSAENRTAQTGVDYALTFTVIGGRAPYTWSIVSGNIPTGLTFDPVLGVLSGKATTTGAFTFVVRVQDQLGSSATSTVCITVSLPPATVFATNATGDIIPGENRRLTIGDLVNSLLGPGVTVSNVRLNGQSLAEGRYAGAGVFEGAAGILGIERGIILSSGAVADSKGPNNSDTTTGALSTPGDADLTALARLTSLNPGVQTFDATVLEFEFVPQGNRVSFRYVFGSEEDNEFVASQYNDAFGFFITGPDGIKRNYALVPNTEDPVTINSINGGNPLGTLPVRNAHLYRNNDPSDGAPTIDIEADGLTVVLTLTADVIPNEVHTMKLAIGDAGDAAYDSWVFIEGGSFRVVENCTNGIDDDGDGLVDGNDPDCVVCAVSEQPAGDDAFQAAATIPSVNNLGVAAASDHRQPTWLARRRRQLAALQAV